jgi:hypothetical protein
VKKQGKWTLDAIAESIYIIACHVHDHQEKLLAKGECVSTDSKIIALVLMYSFFITKINLAEAIRQLQNKATAMNPQQQQQEAEVNKATSTKLPIRCKQCMHFIFVLMKRISSSPNHSPRTSPFPNPRRPDRMLAELRCSPNSSPSIKSLLGVQ